MGNNEIRYPYLVDIINRKSISKYPVAEIKLGVATKELTLA